jgi:hypothetical protein
MLTDASGCIKSDEIYIERDKYAWRQRRQGVAVQQELFKYGQRFPGWADSECSESRSFSQQLR